MDIPESLHFIKSGNQKMEILLNGLLRLSRIGTAQINPTSINMETLIGGIISGLRFKIRENNIDIAIDGTLPACRGDLMLINQVFVNLVDNAIKYRHPDRPCRIRIRGTQKNGQSIYQVEDNGIGIAPEHKEKVFEIFHQLNPNAGGEGLGLTIVNRILDRQDGQIQLDSQPGTGTTISITLPGA
jgi:signal transduction histidine kinase